MREVLSPASSRLARTALIVAALAVGSRDADAKGPIKVTFLSGRADVATGGGAPVALKLGATVAEGDTIATHEATKLELALADGSKVRLASNTKVTLSEGRFADKGRNVTVSLWVGSLWAKVAKAVAGGDSFEVETKNAVAGVRGTAFAVQAAADLSAMVRVYTGTVGVRKSSTDAFGAKPRKQIPGPERIDKKQWEEIIATAMKQVKISSVGEIAPAEDFEDSGEALEWALWNNSRDTTAVR